MATQHSGTGKANQYFIRGFNLDHGTDFAVSVDGVPVNLRSHGHGQGYLDLNFLIPELVETARYQRGPYSARAGDFSSAASVDFGLYDRIDDPILTASVGNFGYRRSLAAGSLATGTSDLTAAVDVTRYDGPWELSEDLDQLKIHAAYSGRLGGADGRVTLQGYSSEWNSTDQVPRRAVQSGAIGRLGNVDDDLGGETERLALTASLNFGSWSARAYAIDYDFRLYSNFTYFLNDPKDGDEFEQVDRRRVYGIGFEGGAGIPRSRTTLELRWGGDVRLDDIGEVGLHATTARDRSRRIRSDSVRELSAGLWSELEWRINARLRGTLGARVDGFDWRVRAARDPNSGRGSDSIISPKLAIAWRLADFAEAYVNAGRSFHSNDVRGTTITVDPVTGDHVDSVPALVRSDGAEIGIRLERSRNFNATLTGFRLDLDSELVYVGDAGTTEPNGATQRLGLESSVFWQVNDVLALDAAYTTTRAEYRGAGADGREIPGAVPSTFVLGASAVWGGRWSASVRARWLDGAPLVEDGSVRSGSSTLVNAGLTYRAGPVTARLDVFNLLDSEDADISYFYESRLANELSGGVEDIHFHPLEPRSARLSLTWHWD
ncbi:MAG: TonB-dependent receptor [Pseudomonadota bacterium]